MSRPARLKKHIEEAAIRLFSEKGLAATTIRDIAQTAGVAEGTMYRYYKSKSEMAWQLQQQEVRKFTKGYIEILFNREKSFRQRLREGVEYTYDYYEKEPVRLSFVLLHQHDFPQNRLLDENENPYDVIRRFVEEGIKEGKIRKEEPNILVAALFGIILQPIVMSRYGRIKGRVRDHSEFIACACIRALEAK